MANWSRFEAGFTRHRKRVECGPIASWLWVSSIDYCTVSLTDGFIPASIVSTLVPGLRRERLRKCVELLVKCGSWIKVDGGYEVKDYLIYNPSREKVNQERAAARARYDRWLNKQQPNAATNASDNASDQRVSNDRRTNERTDGIAPPAPREGSKTPTNGRRFPLEMFHRAGCRPPAQWPDGTCVDRAWLAAHPEVTSYPVVSDGAPRSCEAHR